MTDLVVDNLVQEALVAGTASLTIDQMVTETLVEITGFIQVDTLLEELLLTNLPLPKTSGQQTYRRR